MKAQKTMLDALRALVSELGQNEGFSVFEWYCYLYRVDVSDDCPAAIAHEIWGI